MVKKIISLFLLITIGFSSCAFAQSRVEELFEKIKIQPFKELQRAPDFRLENLEGKIIEWKRLKGKVVLLNFWATWCSPCKEEMPSMETLYQRFHKENFTLLAISVDYADKKSIKEFVEKRRYSFPILLDSKGKVLDLYRVRAIPTTLLIDQRGAILGKAIGPRRWDMPEVFSLIQILIGKN